jgi:CID domain
VPSSARVAALGKFLTAIADSTSIGESSTGEKPRRQRTHLHILYLLNDVLHWQKYHERRTRQFTTFAVEMQDWISDLVESYAQASSVNPSNPKYQHRILELLEIWSSNAYFAEPFVQSLRESASSFVETKSQRLSKDGFNSSAGTQQPKEGKSAPWIMPATHGDPSTPYYDLPAANMIPLIKPNSSRPIDPGQMKPLRLASGPADKKLISLVEDLINEVDRIYDGTTLQDDEYVVPDVDAMGQEIILDEMGERIGGDTYYGWSRVFCGNMHKKLHGISQNNGSRSQSRSQSRARDGSSRSRSRSPRKRRRSLSSSRSRSRGRHRRRGDYTPSRSLSRDRYRSRSRGRRSDSHSPPRRGPGSRSPHSRNPKGPPLHIRPPIPPVSIPMALDGVPIPPPLPPGWPGPWPPPPPPLPFDSQLPVVAPLGFFPPPPPNFTVGGQQPPFIPQGIPPPPPGAGHNWPQSGFKPGWGNGRGRGRGR